MGVRSASAAGWMRGCWKLAALLVIACAPQTWANSPPEVSNVTANQRQDASKVVDIHYDLEDADDDACAVTVLASDDGGATWDLPISALSGDIGPGVTPGEGKHIVWNPAADIPGESGSQFKVRVCADDGQMPGGMVLIPGGEFEMGDHWGGGQSDERPVHDVYVDSFSMSVYETTNEEYCVYLNSAYAQGLIEVNGGVVYKAGDSEPYCDTTSSSQYSRIHWDESTFTVTAGKEDHPMVDVSWYGAVAYANWRSVEEGLETSYDLETWECNWGADGYRLPTESEWEYAARGAEHDPYYKYPWGNDVDGSKANYWESGDPYEGAWPETTPIGYYNGSQTPPGIDMANGYGLYDMAGNVWEWCHDWYDGGYYDYSPFDNPTGPSNGTYRVFRDGSWGVIDKYMRCANRDGSLPDTRYRTNGFRLALHTP